MLRGPSAASTRAQASTKKSAQRELRSRKIPPFQPYGAAALAHSPLAEKEVSTGRCGARGTVGRVCAVVLCVVLRGRVEMFWMRCGAGFVTFWYGWVGGRLRVVLEVELAMDWNMAVAMLWMSWTSWIAAVVTRGGHSGMRASFETVEGGWSRVASELAPRI